MEQNCGVMRCVHQAMLEDAHRSYYPQGRFTVRTSGNFIKKLWNGISGRR
ncbi:hypothetical protein [Alicyclobacillus acidiphilus]|nr:hypothetical protein [Alicyclobacillus acidiphilus]